VKLADAVVAFRSKFAADEPFHDAFDSLVDASKRATPDERDAAIVALLDPTGITHAEVSGFLCIASGALVEDGASTLLGMDAILDQLADGAEILAASGSALDEADLDAMADPPPAALARDERRWVAGWKSHVRGAMARLARDIETRKLARAHPRLTPAVRALAARTSAHHLRYIIEILDMLDDTRLDVVDLPGGKITRMRVSGIRNGFHLMTLLDGKDPFRIAGEHVTAEHSYFTWRGLVASPDGWSTRGLGELVWGEMRALDLPEFEGVRTVLRAASVFGSRSWDASFVSPIHDALRESLVVESVVEPAGARPVLERMARAAEAGRPPSVVG
jgi:hypothetical protein